MNAVSVGGRTVRKLLWHTHDLRLHDHAVLSNLTPEDELFPVYCLSPHLLQHRPYQQDFVKVGPLRLQFLRDHLMALQQAYRDRGQDLIFRVGEPATVMAELCRRWHIDEIWTPREVTAEELSDQAAVAQAVDPVPLRTFDARWLVDVNALPFPLARLPKSFTGFRKRVESLTSLFPPPLPAPERLPVASHEAEPVAAVFPDLASEMPDARTAFPFAAGEQAAFDHLHAYIWRTQRVATYKDTRNGLIGPDFSSKLSPWLASGALSARYVYAQVKAFEAEVVANDSTYWLIFELLWRDYFRLVAAQHGTAIFQRGGIQRRTLDFQSSPQAFERWRRGDTAQPFVNACMRELALTGYLSNRGRQNAASYLCYDLDVDWRWGAAWFEHCLLDYDPCSNWGNWMYIAGVGNGGPQRRFDVARQAEYYDPEGAYQALWSAKNFSKTL